VLVQTEVLMKVAGIAGKKNIEVVTFIPQWNGILFVKGIMFY
jgi:hypothetical protein